MKVSNSSRQFPRVYRGFPTLSNPPWGSSMMSEGSQPVAPTLHVKKKLITECREKSDHRAPRKKCMSRKKRIHVNKKEAHTCQEKMITAWREKIDDWWVLTIDWSLIIDDWWLIIDDWWLMIDDWWLMTDIIWNGPHIVCPRGDPPWGKLYLTFHIISVINHQSSIISHQSSIINHHSSIINQ